jgi:hypothetical protein
VNRCPCDTCPKIEGRVESDSDNQRQRQIVWTLKRAGGNIVTGPDVHVRALVRRADMLHRQGAGGGIGSLLLPTTAKGRKRLELDRTKYQLRRVKPRKTGERGRARELSVIACFLCHALSLKEHANPAWSTEMFLTWMITELANDASPVRKLAIANEEFQVFLNEPRRLRWWRNRVTELRKMSR